MHRHDDMIHCRKSAAVDIGRRSHQLTGVLKCICVCVCVSFQIGNCSLNFKRISMSGISLPSNVWC